MRWPIVRLIWRREFRDLLRDRRTLLMLFGLPVVLYPAFGVIGIAFALTVLETQSIVGVERIDQLPAATPFSGDAPYARIAGLAAGLGADPTAAVGLWIAGRQTVEPPPLLRDGTFPAVYGDLIVSPQNLRFVPVEDGAAALAERRIDVLLTVPLGFTDALARGERPTLTVESRQGDEPSKLALVRLRGVLGKWHNSLKAVKFRRAGLPDDFDTAVNVRDPQDDKNVTERTSESLRDSLARFFPFILVMWAMAGALHPAIDLCAGEKERGTMETLLISPADRPEIVAGKFLATWLFSSLTALWNLLWLGGGLFALNFVPMLNLTVVTVPGLFWCVALLVPTAALFSAVCLALGVYARSTKEGQYYLLPMFMLVLPLSFASLTPGMEINFWNALVPITGPSLLLQKLLSVAPGSFPWPYFVPVLASLGLCIVLSLRWAVAQFRREDVLFREAERLDLGLWLRRMFRAG